MKQDGKPIDWATVVLCWNLLRPAVNGRTGSLYSLLPLFVLFYGEFLVMLRPTPWSHCSDPKAETLFSVSRAWHERKDTATGRGNHEKAASHPPTGSVSFSLTLNNTSQSDTSLTLLLLAVSHFAFWLPWQGDGFIPPIHFIIGRVKSFACRASIQWWDTTCSWIITDAHTFSSDRIICSSNRNSSCGRVYRS